MLLVVSQPETPIVQGLKGKAHLQYHPNLTLMATMEVAVYLTPYMERAYIPGSQIPTVMLNIYSVQPTPHKEMDCILGYLSHQLHQRNT